MDDETLTICELAVLLKIGERTAYIMGQSGELPSFKVRDQWRMRRVRFDVWSAGKVSAQGRTTEEAVNLSLGHKTPRLQRGTILTDVAGSRRQA